jgi:hypothetical protein
MEVPFEERNISKDKDAKKLFLQQGYALLPVIEVGATTILDYTEASLIEALAREGYLLA